MELETRPLVASDKEQMQSLCRECFPIDYPDRWFDRQLSGDADLLAVGVTEKRTGQLVGIIVGQLQPLSEVESEYGALLNKADTDDKVMYIVIFGEFLKSKYIAYVTRLGMERPRTSKLSLPMPSVQLGETAGFRLVLSPV